MLDQAAIAEIEKNAAEGQAVLRDHVQRRAFFEKLASDWDIRPQSEAEAQQLLDLAVELRQARQREQVKEAQSGNPFFAEVLAGVRGVVAQSTGQPAYDPNAERQEQHAKEAAARLLQDDGILNAAMNYGVYLGTVELLQNS